MFLAARRPIADKGSQDQAGRTGGGKTEKVQVEKVSIVLCQLWEWRCSSTWWWPWHTLLTRLWQRLRQCAAHPSKGRYTNVSAVRVKKQKQKTINFKYGCVCVFLFLSFTRNAKWAERTKCERLAVGFQPVSFSRSSASQQQPVPSLSSLDNVLWHGFARGKPTHDRPTGELECPWPIQLTLTLVCELFAACTLDYHADLGFVVLLLLF